MKQPFSEPEAIKFRAEKQQHSLLRQLQKWWESKYSMPANCEAFESRTLPDLQTAMLGDLLDRRDELRGSYESKHGKEGANAILESINNINKALGEDLEGIDLVAAKWDKEFELGKDIDFD